MKHFQYILAALFLISGMSSCCKDKAYKSSAEITGIDYRKCSCCGGFFVNINNGTSWNVYRTTNTPSNLHLPSDTQFPVYVNIDWEETGTCGGETLITITRMKYR